MPQPEIVNDGITKRLKELFENSVEELSVLWKDYQPAQGEKEQDPTKGRLPQIFEDLQEQLIYTPSIEIVNLTTKTDIFSIGTQEDRYDFNIICTVGASHPTESGKYLRIFSKSIFDLLNLFENRSFTVPGYEFKAYYSEASNIDYGFRRGKGLRSAKITWYCKLLKANRYT